MNLKTKQTAAEWYQYHAPFAMPVHKTKGAQTHARTDARTIKGFRRQWLAGRRGGKSKEGREERGRRRRGMKMKRRRRKKGGGREEGGK